MLVQCVGADLRLGAGLAKKLVAKFGRPREQSAPVGTVVYQKTTGGMVIASMVTKPLSSQPGNHDELGYLRALRSCLRQVLRSYNGYDVVAPYLSLIHI